MEGELPSFASWSATRVAFYASSHPAAILPSSSRSFRLDRPSIRRVYSTAGVRLKSTSRHQLARANRLQDRTKARATCARSPMVKPSVLFHSTTYFGRFDFHSLQSPRRGLAIGGVSNNSWEPGSAISNRSSRVSSQPAPWSRRVESYLSVSTCPSSGFPTTKVLRVSAGALVPSAALRSSSFRAAPRRIW